jgi:hypothetical protein
MLFLSFYWLLAYQPYTLPTNKSDPVPPPVIVTHTYNSYLILTTAKQSTTGAIWNAIPGQFNSATLFYAHNADNVSMGDIYAPASNTISYEYNVLFYNYTMLTSSMRK